MIGDLEKQEKTIETFVPLYITNYCDGLCKVCNMRANNEGLRRIRGSKDNIRRQLNLILNIEGISAICFLTGEYHFGSKMRKDNLQAVLWSIHTAFEMGFKKVYFNIGALTNDEIQSFKSEFDSADRIVLSLFQETYDFEAYSRFFGNVGFHRSPKADYALRLSTPTRWLEAGFKRVDIGILIGLKEPMYDVDALIKHAHQMNEQGAVVHISLPRLRGVKSIPVEVSDKEFEEIVAYVHESCPWAKIVITTRESIGLIKRMLPNIQVVSPGTSDVLPYTEYGPLPNSRKTYI